MASTVRCTENLSWGRCKNCRGVRFVNNGVISEFEKTNLFMPTTGNLTDFSTRATPSLPLHVMSSFSAISMTKSTSSVESFPTLPKVKQRSLWKPYEDIKEETKSSSQCQPSICKPTLVYRLFPNPSVHEKPFRCDHVNCGKSFARNEELTRHKRTHSGERPYQCQTCRKRFGRKDHLTKHSKTHLKVSERKSYVCSVDGCERRYTRSDALTRHQSTVHNIKWKEKRFLRLSSPRML